MLAPIALALCTLQEAAAAPAVDLVELVRSGPLTTVLREHGEAIVPATLDEALRTAIWDRRKAEIRADERRQTEHREQQMRSGEKVMRYAAFRRGEPGEAGFPLYIALHGGGGAPSRVNDSQWEHMKVYYRESVDSGVYVAARGIADTWNLHSVGESFALYDRLIENMIAFEDVDPDRVYVLGFSAGGDGTYQIAPRMADRLAAANMSAGHHNGVSPRNLYHVPFLLQVGQNDTAYGRHHVTVQYAQRLQALQEQEAGGYEHALFVHAGKGHNFRDNDPARTLQPILSDPEGWLDSGESESHPQDTNAISWLSRHVRDPLPERVVWQPGLRADRRDIEGAASPTYELAQRDRRHYWLGLPDGASTEGEILASYDRDSRTVVLEAVPDAVLVLLDRRMMSLDEPVRLLCEGEAFEVPLEARLGWMIRSVLERGDPLYCFEAAVEVRRQGEGWQVRPVAAR